MPELLPNEILDKIKKAASEAKNAKPPKSFRPPRWGDFAPSTRTLCFDQTLNNCGWALVTVDSNGGGITVDDSGTIQPPSLDVKGFEATFVKATVLGREIRKLLLRMRGRYEQVVLELPSVFGYRTESSLVAAVTIILTLDEMGERFPALISRQSAGAYLCGDRHAPKNVSSSLVHEMVFTHQNGKGQWNEHVKDAVFVGLRHLYQEAE